MMIGLCVLESLLESGFRLCCLCLIAGPPVSTDAFSPARPTTPLFVFPLRPLPPVAPPPPWWRLLVFSPSPDFARVFGAAQPPPAGPAPLGHRCRASPKTVGNPAYWGVGQETRGGIRAVRSLGARNRGIRRKAGRGSAPPPDPAFREWWDHSQVENSFSFFEIFGPGGRIVVDHQQPQCPQAWGGRRITRLLRVGVGRLVKALTF